jgi:Uma2 family endonuclease
MNASFLINHLPQDAILILKGVTWRAYSRFLRGFEEEPGVRLIYEKGTLEIWAPRTGIRWCGRFFGRLVATLTEELQLPVLGGGSTTLRCRTRRCGIEADECFWIENTHRMGGRLDLDLQRDPPPDLAIEAEARHGYLDRPAIYGALRVPELWRLEGDVLGFFVLEPDGKYRNSTHSKAFPTVTPADLVPYLERARREADENPIIRDIRKWVRSLK